MLTNVDRQKGGDRDRIYVEDKPTCFGDFRSSRFASDVARDIGAGGTRLERTSNVLP
jgi:hypothetical protein